MRNPRRRFAAMLTVLASLILFMGSLIVGEHSQAQNPTPKTDTPSTAEVKLEDAKKPITTKVDDRGRPLEQATFDDKGRLIGTTEIKGYDANGQPTEIKLTTTKDENSSSVTQVFDEGGRLTRQTNESFLNGAAADKTEEEWHYDTQGRLLFFESKILNNKNDQVGGIRVIKQYDGAEDLDGTTKYKKWDTTKKDYVPTSTPVVPSFYDPTIAIVDLRRDLKLNNPTEYPKTEENVPSNFKPTALPGFNVETITGNGLNIMRFTTPNGELRLNLTNDVSAGDSITGTVEEQPKGTTESERAHNQDELNGYVFELGGQKTKVGDKKISCVIPNVLTIDTKFLVLQHNGQTVATTQIPISNAPPPTPNQLTLPTGGQQGRTIECLGNFAPTDQVKIGGTIMPTIAGSPRKLVVRNTSEVIGPTTIECSQHGVVSQCPFRNLGIKLTAPKLNLRRGETTTLHVVVTGLAGINQPVPLDLVNNSPSVISMSGGNVQHLNIQPTQVQTDGTATFDFTLTGNTAGGFNITATAKWDEVCKRP